MEEDKVERKRRLQRERSARFRARQNAGNLERLRNENRERRAPSLRFETAEQRRVRLDAIATRIATHRISETIKKALPCLEGEVDYGIDEAIQEKESDTLQEDEEEVVHIKEERSNSPCLPSTSFRDHTTMETQCYNSLPRSTTNSTNPIDSEFGFQGFPRIKMENEDFAVLDSRCGTTVSTSSSLQSQSSSTRSLVRLNCNEENSICEDHNDSMTDPDKYSRLIVIAPFNPQNEPKDADYSSRLSTSPSSGQCNNFQSTFNSQSSFEGQNTSSPEIKNEPLETIEDQIGQGLVSNQSLQLPRSLLSDSLSYPNFFTDLHSIIPTVGNQRSFLEIAFHHMLGVAEAPEERKQRLTRERIAWWKANLDQETINQLWLESRERVTNSEMLFVEETREERKRRLTRERVARWRANLDKKTIDRLKSENRERIAKCRTKPETPEERQARLDADAKRKAEHRKQETPEQRRARLDADARRMALRRMKLTPDELQARRKENARWVANRRKNETPEERRARLDANARWQANRRKNETPEQRMARLEADAKRIAIRRRREKLEEAKSVFAGSESALPPAEDHISTRAQKAHLKTAFSIPDPKLSSSSMVPGVQSNRDQTEPTGFSEVKIEDENSSFLGSVFSDSVSATSNLHSLNIEFLSEEEGGQLSNWGSPNYSDAKERQRADETASTLFCLRENVLKLLRKVIPHCPVFQSAEQVPLESVDKILEELLANMNSGSQKMQPLISIPDV